MKASKRRAIVYCASIFEFRIFMRFRAPLAARSWPTTFVTHRLSIFLLALAGGAQCVLLRPVEAPEPFAASVHDALARAWGAAEEVALIQWSGQRAYGRAATSFARERGLRTAFADLGNIVPKLFIDPDGVHGASRLARRPEILDAYPVSEDDVAAWVRAAIEARRQTTPPQAKAAGRINGWFALDYFGSIALGIPQPERVHLGQKVLSKLRVLAGIKGPPAILPERPYVFFPMQVSNEVDVLLPPRQKDREALAFAARYARDQGLLLVVKPHPVEIDGALLNEVKQLCAREGHLMTSANSARLVEGAHAVVTINSSVGLEAVLLEKPLIVLGDSYFADFSRRRLAVFAMKHLVDFQPFGKEDLSREGADRLVDILEGRS